jgi:Glycosyl hydrolase family 57
MQRLNVILSIVLIAAFTLSACQTPTPTAAPPTQVPAPTQTSAPQPTQTPSADVLYLSIVWHQHQPLYYKDPTTGIYTRPWVRVHATKDYYDMAAMLKAYPNVRVTFNLTPVLIR